MISPVHALRLALKRQLLLVSCLLLGACGQTGPLYLPEDAAKQRGTSEQETAPAHQHQN